MAIIKFDFLINYTLSGEESLPTPWISDYKRV